MELIVLGFLIVYIGYSNGIEAKKYWRNTRCQDEVGYSGGPEKCEKDRSIKTLVCNPLNIILVLSNLQCRK